MGDYFPLGWAEGLENYNILGFWPDLNSGPSGVYKHVLLARNSMGSFSCQNTPIFETRFTVFARGEVQSTSNRSRPIIHDVQRANPSFKL